MLVTTIVRGNLIAWTATFLDVDQAPVDPATVVLNVSHLTAAGRVDAEVTMAGPGSDGSYDAEWDSSVALKGRVFWSVRASAPPAADEGFFDLKANLGNPDPA